MRLPESEGLSAGLVAFQNETHHYYLGVERKEKHYTLFLESAKGQSPEIVRTTTLPLHTERLVLGTEGEAGTRVSVMSDSTNMSGNNG